jgi:hypothetical protein
VHTLRPFAPTHSAFFGAVLFLLFVLAGAAYIMWAKVMYIPAVQVTGIPLALMLVYALVLGLARHLRLRDDQAGDNLYYLGFLYTLTSLGVSLSQFNASDRGESIVTNFGIAIASTILGVTLRVVFNQMRQDPIEVERTARLELADAARKVKQELDATTFEFAGFRRALHQMFQEALIQNRENAERLTKELFDALKEFPNWLSEPLRTASEQSKEAIDELAKTLVERLTDTGKTLASQEEKLFATAGKVTSSLEEVHARLKAMQTPDGIIEIKLQPFISGFTKAINAQSKATAEQMAALQKVNAPFVTSVRQLAEHMSEYTQSRAEDQKFLRDLASEVQTGAAEARRLVIELHKVIAQFDASVRQLAEHMSEYAQSRAEDQKFLRDVVSELQTGAAETRRLVIELDNKLAASPSRPLELPARRARWFSRRTP